MYVHIYIIIAIYTSIHIICKMYNAYGRKKVGTKLLETLPAFNINNLLNNISNDVIKDMKE